MVDQRSLVLAVLIPLFACDQGAHRKTATPDPGAAKLPEWHAFEGIEFHAPKGLDTRLEDGVLPGPGGMGGIPSGVELTLTLTAPPRRFFMQIIKTSYVLTLEGMKQTYVANKLGTNVTGKTTSNGFELTHEMPKEAGQPASLDHLIYADIAGGHYQCRWADQNTDDPALAEAICRSMRAKADR